MYNRHEAVYCLNQAIRCPTPQGAFTTTRSRGRDSLVLKVWVGVCVRGGAGGVVRSDPWCRRLEIPSLAVAAWCCKNHCGSWGPNSYISPSSSSSAQTTEDYEKVALTLIARVSNPQPNIKLALQVEKRGERRFALAHLPAGMWSLSFCADNLSSGVTYLDYLHNASFVAEGGHRKYPVLRKADGSPIDSFNVSAQRRLWCCFPFRCYSPPLDLQGAANAAMLEAMGDAEAQIVVLKAKLAEAAKLDVAANLAAMEANLAAAAALRVAFAEFGASKDMLIATVGDAEARAMGIHSDFASLSARGCALLAGMGLSMAGNHAASDARADAATAAALGTHADDVKLAAAGCGGAFSLTGSRVCSSCGEADPVSVCMGCQSVSYCGPFCQREHWRRKHNQDCKDFARVDFQAGISAVPADNVGAQYRAGRSLLYGSGVAADPVEGFALLRRAAEAGHVDAQLEAGRCLLGGLGVAADPAEAVTWLRRAAEAGHMEAQCQLAICFLCGSGVVANKVQALHWFYRAACAGNPEAIFHVSSFFVTGGGGIEADAVEATTWLHKSAEAEHPIAQYWLGVGYINGTGVAADAEEGVAWLHRSAIGGCAPAYGLLGVCYLNGTGVHVDTVLGVAWLRRAVEAGDSVAKTDRTGVASDAAEAVRLFRGETESGYANAQYRLGLCYIHGTGVAVDAAQAVALICKAADAGVADARTLLDKLESSAVPVEMCGTLSKIHSRPLLPALRGAGVLVLGGS